IALFFRLAKASNLEPTESHEGTLGELWSKEIGIKEWKELPEILQSLLKGRQILDLIKDEKLNKGEFELKTMFPYLNRQEEISKFSKNRFWEIGIKILPYLHKLSKEDLHVLPPSLYGYDEFPWETADIGSIFCDDYEYQGHIREIFR